MMQTAGTLAAQRRTQKAVQQVLEDLRPGQTELELAASLRGRLLGMGATGFFHEPLAWIGKRTAFEGMGRKADTFPSSRALERGDNLILDVAPCFPDGVCDVSHAAGLEPSPRLVLGLQALQELRDLLPGWVSERYTGRDITAAVTAHARTRGLESCQHHYLFGALGHRVYTSPPLLRGSAFGLGLGSGLRLFGRAAAHRVAPGLVPWPFWSDSRHSNSPPGDGLWSVEPHLRIGSVGVKWEELMLIEGGQARWLDPENPLF